MIAAILATALIAQSNLPSAPVPTATPIVTALLTYKVPPHGYRVRSSTAFGNATFSQTSLVDGYGNRDVDLTLSVQGRTTHGEYLVMDGLTYLKSGSAWAPVSLDRATAAVILSATYPLPSLFAPPARTVSDQGMGKCAVGTCKLFLASGVSKLEEQPVVTVWHVAVDPQTSYLSSVDSTIVRSNGSNFMKMNEQFDQYDTVHLAVPDISAPAATSQCEKATASIGSVDVCVIKGMFADDVYTLRVGDTLALRASETSVENGTPSPVLNGVTLRCDPKRQSQTVNPALAQTLERSGMSDAQIAATLGERTVASDCTVLSGSNPVAAVHFDFK